METNKVLDKLPRHLLDLIIDQPYNEYSSQDHALWRYVMRQNVHYLSKVAHGSYLEGLKKTGISIDRIPHMYGMNRILKEIGWAAVAVDGFIPPSAFMEFQAYKVLVIAADIRPIDQIEYTPAPDIIHEAAGHAPIIAHEEYAEYLKLFGEIGHKAFSSAHDHQVYEAIRHLSILKANPYTDKEKITEAEKKLEELENRDMEASEMSKIRNLHWWTVEYGLIGEIDKPKIYGAGLLSSIGESYNCLQPHVKKRPYTLDAKNVGFDITSQQPQLFVTPDFNHLKKVLLEFSEEMALKKGGLYGLKQAIKSENTATVVLSSGIQVSGHFTDYKTKNGELIWFKTNGPSSLSEGNKQLKGHGKDYHLHGFSSPIGKIKGLEIPLEHATEAELATHKIIPGERCRFEFQSGIQVDGFLEEIIRKEQVNILFTLSACRLTFDDEILFDPSWGTFDMAIGEQLVSAFPGPADPKAWGLRYQPPKEKTQKITHSQESQKLQLLYSKVRSVREGMFDVKMLSSVWMELQNNFPNDWLLPLEILEIVIENNEDNSLAEEIRNFLNDKKENEKYSTLIENGLLLLEQ
jgi:phenylalanine-4-hydroxylase